MAHTLRTTVLACALAVAGGLASTAVAQPDITYSDIDASTAQYGPINGKYAYIWGTYTCNMGTQSLNWLNGGTPAVAFNAYRLYDGRMMQIGLGYCKTACCAGNGSGCGITCQTGSFGLHPGCRDFYSAGYNAGQTHLGPRSGINAFSGTMVSIPAGSGDAIWRRCQVAATDMSAAAFPGARFFAEGEYICTDELPGTPAQLNNATYRPMTVANTGASPTYVWTGTGVSAVGQPAIYAWHDHGLGLNMPDPSVHVVTADVPGEGRFIAAGKVTTLPNSLYRYDYAVFNLNSHRSGGSFSVNIPSSATVSGVGFNAPLYHSDEVYANTPWTSGKFGTAVLFSAPEKYETNPNTNALRWGTMYNFWFTSNIPPASVTGNATLGLFRPGTAGSPNAITISGLPVPGTQLCAADMDYNGALGVQDLFTFLNFWFAVDPRADFNHVNGVTIEDVWSYLGAWFTGC